VYTKLAAKAEPHNQRLVIVKVKNTPTPKAPTSSARQNTSRFVLRVNNWVIFSRELCRIVTLSLVPRSRLLASVINAAGRSVSRYFFSIRDSDRRVEDDLHGTDLPNAAAALSCAER